MYKICDLPAVQNCRKKKFYSTYSSHHAAHTGNLPLSRLIRVLWEDSDTQTSDRDCKNKSQLSFRFENVLMIIAVNEMDEK